MIAAHAVINIPVYVPVHMCLYVCASMCIGACKVARLYTWVENTESAAAVASGGEFSKRALEGM